MTPKLLTAEEVAERLAVSLSTIYKLAVRGELPSYQFGGMRRFDAEEIETWLEERKVA